MKRMMRPEDSTRTAHEVPDDRVQEFIDEGFVEAPADALTTEEQASKVEDAQAEVPTQTHDGE